MFYQEQQVELDLVLWKMEILIHKLHDLVHLTKTFCLRMERDVGEDQLKYCRKFMELVGKVRLNKH